MMGLKTGATGMTVLSPGAEMGKDGKQKLSRASGHLPGSLDSHAHVHTHTYYSGIYKNTYLK